MHHLQTVKCFSCKPGEIDPSKVIAGLRAWMEPVLERHGDTPWLKEYTEHMGKYGKEGIKDISGMKTLPAMDVVDTSGDRVYKRKSGSPVCHFRFPGNDTFRIVRLRLIATAS